MNTSEQARSWPCNEYVFSNDRWEHDNVQELRRNLANRKALRERATAIVVGSGTLPYSLEYLGVSRVVIVDCNLRTIKSTKTSIETIQKPDLADWGAWYGHRYLTAGSDVSTQFDREYTRARQSGLLGDFATTRALVSDIEVVGMHGDILDALPELARTLPKEGREVSFMNLTNVGDYITQPGKELFDNQTGLRALLGLARELPLAENAVIVESSLHLLYPSVHIAQPFIDEWAFPAPATA